MDKYKQNLRVVGTKVISYDTEVGNIDFCNKILYQLGWWSVTTQKHINYVAKEYNLRIFKK